MQARTSLSTKHIQSNLKKYPSVAIETLPDPPAPGTFSPARAGTATSATAPYASSTHHPSGLMSVVLSPANAGLFLAVALSNFVVYGLDPI